MLRVVGEILESEKKKLRIQKYPDTCGRGPRNCLTIKEFFFTKLKKKENL